MEWDVAFFRSTVLTLDCEVLVVCAHSCKAATGVPPPTLCNTASCGSVCLSRQDVILSSGDPPQPLKDIVQVLLNLGMVRAAAVKLGSSWPLSPVPSLPSLPVACCGHHRPASGGSGALCPLAHCQQDSGGQQHQVPIPMSESVSDMVQPQWLWPHQHAGAAGG